MNSISTKTKIGQNVKFGKFVTVYDNVEIGNNTIIDSYSEIGVSNGKEKGGLRIGENAHVRSHSVIYTGSNIGSFLSTAHFSVIRENVDIGDNFQIGVNCLIQPNCKIGNHVRIIANSMITHNSTIEDFVWVFPFATFASDRQPPSSIEPLGPTIRSYAIIAAGAIVLPGVQVGKGAIVAAGCVLTKDLPDNMVAKGVPGKIVGPSSKIKLHGTDDPAYPWTKHFHRGYPEDVISRWKALHNKNG
jgi:acetyltransferase-like isoleucine patch superfamily enzyme